MTPRTLSSCKTDTHIGYRGSSRDAKTHKQQRPACGDFCFRSKARNILHNQTVMAKLLAKEMVVAINELMLCKDEETDHQKPKECFSQLIRRRSLIKTERTSEKNENTNQELSRTSEAMM